MTTTDKVENTNRINVYAIPRPTDGSFARQLELPQSAASRADWLPAKEPEALAKLRPKHLHLVAQVATAQRALLEAERKFREEDEERNKALRNAYKQGRPPADLQPVPQAEREATRKALTERLWVAVVALAEFVESIILTVQVNEDMLLKAPREERLQPVREKRRRAQRLYEEALAEEFKLDRLGRWLQITADAGKTSVGLQPAPTGAERPPHPSWQLRPEALERPWHDRRPWNTLEADTEEAA
jgi:hypothetical protein